jgi:hypothetical protein
MLSSKVFCELLGTNRKQLHRYRKRGMPSIKKGAYYFYDMDSIKWLFNSSILKP